MTSDAEKGEWEARLLGIEDGPWARGAKKAARWLAKAGEKELAHTLRLHYLDDDDVIDDEIEHRDALDDALMVPQLYELAVETGYLPMDVVDRPARKFFKDVLGSEAARNFVVGYDYVGVSMLASRLDLPGFAPIAAPPIQAHSPLKFAAFLAHLREFYGNEAIVHWISFMDDYREGKEDPEEFFDYLDDEGEETPEWAPPLVGGALAFVQSLGHVFMVMDEKDLVPFGLVHAYWLAKFLGYELDTAGYVPDGDWEDDSWADTFMRTARLKAGLPADEAKAMRQDLSTRIRMLRKAFQAVRAVATKREVAAAPNATFAGTKGIRRRATAGVPPELVASLAQLTARGGANAPRGRVSQKKAAVKRRPNAAFMKPMTPSSTLAAVVGNSPLPHTEVTSRLWRYIKKNNLQDKTNTRMINADRKLKGVFGKKQVSMFEMTKLIRKHLK